MSIEQFIELIRPHFNIIAIGLCSSNPNVPPHVLVPAMADAFGRVLSEATASPDFALTVKLRSMAQEAFTHSLKKTVPAMQNVMPVNVKAS
jgi:hypothetical protein